MDTGEKLLMEVIPKWNCHIGRAFKQGLADGISPPLHYAMVHLKKPRTMSELANQMRMSKQQMTKTIDRLTEMGYTCRINDENDRRLVWVSLSQKGIDYLSDVMSKQQLYLHEMYASMTSADKSRFDEAMQTLNSVFDSMDQYNGRNEGENGK